MTEYDPKLKAAMKEIRLILEKHDIFGAFNIISPSHGELLVHFPTWSGVQHETPERVTIKIKAADTDKWEQTAHILASTEVYAENLARQFHFLLRELGRHALIGMPKLKITPHRPEMDES